MDRRILTVKLDYTPTEKQAQLHRSGADEVLFGGAAGGGKSIALVMDAFMRCLRKPGLQVYLFRRTYPELRDTLLTLAKRFIPEAAGRYCNAGHDLTLPNGSVMRFRSCQRDQDAYRYQGAEMHALYMDELTHFSRKTFDVLKSRLRAHTELGIRPVLRCASNPGGPGHGWVKAHFVDRGKAGRVHRSIVHSPLLGEAQVRTLQYIPALPTDNPHLSRDYLYELEQKPRMLRDALLHGIWNSFEGQVFTEWRDDPAHHDDRRWTHVIRPFSIPAGWKRYRSFDFGYARPFCVLWFAVGEDGELYLYREWYGCTGNPDEGIRLHAEQIADGILRTELEAGETEVCGIADPSIRDGSRGESIALQMEKRGVFFLPGENARLAGKMQMHARLAFDPEGRPGLQAFSPCRHFIRTLTELTYDPARVEDVDTACEDHAYDAARYLLMARPVRKAAKTHTRRAYDPLEDVKRKEKSCW
jgi:hypothetical protein